MPFTGSHPAAVLPLIRLGFVPSALVIGSMVADLPYFLPIPVDSAITHSPIGIIGVDLLMGLASLVVWQLLVAPLAVAVAPSALRARLPPPKPTRFWRSPGQSPGPSSSPSEGRGQRWWRPGDLSGLLLVVISLIAGAATHVLWDEFTHIGRWGYRHLAWLADPHGPLPGYRWAQYGSGLVGALLIALAVHRWWRTAPVIDPPPVAGVAPAVAVAVLVAVMLSALGGAVAGAAWALLHDQEGIRRALFLTATWGGGAGLVTVLASALLTPKPARDA